MRKKGKYLKFIPNEHQKSVMSIDFLSLYKSGYRGLLIDIDNTLVSYQEHEPKAELIAYIKTIADMGFRIVFISNNNKKRVLTFVGDMPYPFVYSAKKPLKFGFKKALRAIGLSKVSEIVLVGDQIMTDILGGNRMGFYTILVNPIQRKSDILPTRINRKMERFFLNKVKKHQLTLYKERLDDYE